MDIQNDFPLSAAFVFSVRMFYCDISQAGIPWLTRYGHTAPGN